MTILAFFLFQFNMIFIVSIYVVSLRVFFIESSMQSCHMHPTDFFNLVIVTFLMCLEVILHALFPYFSFIFIFYFSIQLLKCLDNISCCFLFRCSVCFQPLKENYYSKENELFCKKHFILRFSHDCQKCNNRITGPVMVCSFDNLNF